MKKVKITFQFNFTGDNVSIMKTTHHGEGETKEAAIMQAWLNMAQDNFKRVLINTTKSIVILDTEFLLF